MALQLVCMISMLIVVASGDQLAVPTIPAMPTMAPLATMPTIPAVPAVPNVATPTLPPVPTVAPAAAVSEITDVPMKGAETGGTLSLRGAQSNQAQQVQTKNSYVSIGHLILMIIFAFFYKRNVVDKYPESEKFNERSAELQGENEVVACCSSWGTTNCLLAWCCWAPRAAHTFDKVGVLPFWPGMALMACFPCCTLTYTNACTDLNERLGGERRNCIMAMLCAWCCACCVVLQDAASLDAATETQTKCCSVEGDVQSGEESN